MSLDQQNAPEEKPADTTEAFWIVADHDARAPYPVNGEFRAEMEALSAMGHQAEVDVKLRETWTMPWQIMVNLSPPIPRRPSPMSDTIKELCGGAATIEEVQGAVRRVLRLAIREIVARRADAFAVASDAADGLPASDVTFAFKVAVNGKHVGEFSVPTTADEGEILATATKVPEVAKLLKGECLAAINFVGGEVRFRVPRPAAPEPIVEAAPCVEATIGVQVDGRTIGTVKMNIPADDSDSTAMVTNTVMADPALTKHFDPKKVLRVDFLPGRLINLVTRGEE